MAKQKLTVKAPATGWKSENLEATGNRKITMSKNAEVSVPDSSGRYVVGLLRPVGQRGPITVAHVFDAEKRELWEASDFEVEIK